MGTIESLQAARDAAVELRRTHRLLAQLDKDARSGQRVSKRYHASLLNRLDPCERATDNGRAVLDSMEVVGCARGWVLDAMRLYYLDALTWPEVGGLVCYSGGHVRRMVTAALDADERMG